MVIPACASVVVRKAISAMRALARQQHLVLQQNQVDHDKLPVLEDVARVGAGEVDRSSKTT